MNAAPPTVRATLDRPPALHPIRDHRRVWELLFVFVAYLLAGELGLAVPFTSGNVSPFWPPAGVALTAVLMFGYGIWPAIFLGSFFVNFLTPIPHLAAAGLACGNTAGPLFGAWLLRRLPGFHASLKRLRDVLAISIAGGFCGTALSATIGVGALYLTGVNAWSGLGAAWLMWWFGDALGVLILAPLFLSIKRLGALIKGQTSEIEFAFLLIGTLSSALAIFDPKLGLMRPDVFAFGVFPFVLWGAIRFEVAGAAIVSFLISTTAVLGTAFGFGPFINGTSLQNATLLQSFLAVTSASGVILAAVMEERADLIREQSTRDALKQSEKRYRGIVETAYEGIWKIDGNYITSFVNPRILELLGYREEEMLGKPLFDFMFGDDIEQKKLDLQRRRLGMSEELETRYRKKDGKALWARVSTSPIVGEKGEFQGALAMISDITEQKRIEEEECRARETISLLSNAVEQTADAVVITDCSGVIQYVNPAFEATTGYSRTEAIGNTPRILKSGVHGQEFYERLWNQLLRGEAFRGTLVNRKKSGEFYWTEQTITGIRDSSGTITHFVSVHRDMTALRKKQEQEMQLRLAREVQERFYADAAISLDGFEIASAAYPAAETGGDYLDVFSMPNGHVCIGIGDVSGHGLDSALVMALTRAYVRAFALKEVDLAKVLSSVNQMLIGDLVNNRYVTLLLVCLDRVNCRVSYASAGHIPGFLMNASGDIDCSLESSGPPLGLFPEPRFFTTAVTLNPPQTLVLLTDGVTEMTGFDDAEFGTDRVLQYVCSHQNRSAHELADGLYAVARSFAGKNPQQDDFTEVIVKIY